MEVVIVRRPFPKRETKYRHVGDPDFVFWLRTKRELLVYAVFGRVHSGPQQTDQTHLDPCM